MVTKWTEAAIEKSIEELSEITKGTIEQVGLFVMNMPSSFNCPELQKFLIIATQTHCHHFIHGIILGILMCKNQEEENTTKELEKLFKMEGKNDL